MGFAAVGLIVLAYFLGAVPFAYIVTRLVKGVDIRTVGSGNVGATNVGRTLGKKWGALVFALDVLKGLAPVLIAQRIGTAADEGTSLAVALTGLAAIAGHNWPIFLGFRGGKGMATSAGVFLVLFWQGVLIAISVWVVTVTITRFVSVGSILAALALLGCAMLLQPDPFADGRYLTALAGVAFVLSVVRHRSNLQRLVQGTENRIGQSGVEVK